MMTRGGGAVASVGFAAVEVGEVRQLMPQAGFRDVGTEVRRLPGDGDLDRRAVLT